ncbi:hypothetical protein PROFUN_15186 [Planoprotostelium fungivorum]|uniref:Uncharacterized protein n=1 Tax=Planoprotostelium fungivorum TaxID=1890364 RepID=A0A2P6MVX5_9EUKA|nr:hypothetical protein PROFUN_15186 [Planoprotostelium fungivorum]
MHHLLTPDRTSIRRFIAEQRQFLRSDSVVSAKSDWAISVGSTSNAPGNWQEYVNEKFTDIGDSEINLQDCLTLNTSKVTVEITLDEGLVWSQESSLDAHTCGSDSDEIDDGVLARLRGYQSIQKRNNLPRHSSFIASSSSIPEFEEQYGGLSIFVLVQIAIRHYSLCVLTACMSISALALHLEITCIAGLFVDVCFLFTGSIICTTNGLGKTNLALLQKSAHHQEKPG